MHIQRKTVGSRRKFLRNTAVLGTLAGVAGLATVTGCSEKPEEEVTPAEDLMREHGVLNRIMLVYDACRNHLVKAEAFDISLLKESAQMLRLWRTTMKCLKKNTFFRGLSTPGSWLTWCRCSTSSTMPAAV